MMRTPTVFCGRGGARAGTRVRRSTHRLRGQHGQSTVELAGMITLVFIAALFVFQAALVGWTAVSATNAARTAVRMASRGGDGVAAGRNSLSGKGLSSDASVTVSGDEAIVSVPLPLVIPGLQLLDLPPITEKAFMPYTG